MSLPCPQRDALETITPKFARWPADCVTKLTKSTSFKLEGSGETIHLLGVSEGAGMRKEPNLHIAVFSFDRRKKGAPSHFDKLREVRFGGLITGPDKDGWHTAFGLRFVRKEENVVVLSRNRHRSKYRTVS